MPNPIIYTNCSLATFDETLQNHTPYGLIDNAALVIDEGKIIWLGKQVKLPPKYNHFAVENLNGRCITPGLIDCHTHILYGGNRAEEFELRLNGATYEQVARAGGGILSTVKHTRKASVDELLKSAKLRIQQMITEGICHIEIKSGYGLNLDTEVKMLRAAKQVGEKYDLNVSKTLLAAHAIPPEYKDNADAYIKHICDDILPQAHGENLVDAVDAFCEGIAFNAKQISKLFDKANALNIPVKIHAEQLSNIGGTMMTANYSALSADHIEYLDQAGIDAMAAANMLAVLLPVAFYTIRETQIPPISALRKAGVAIAIATDCNPGSSPTSSPLLAMNMACTLFRLTPEEALKGFTLNAAKALKIEQDYGSLEIGKIANLAIWDIEHPRQLAYQIGFNPLYKRIFQKKV